MNLETIQPRKGWERCIVAATGPSLSQAVAWQCFGIKTIAVNDAYTLFPWANILYACDAAWWDVHHGVTFFAGEKWSSHDPNGNDKRKAAAQYDLRIIRGQDQEGFSVNPSIIHYGGNSGFQAINLAILLGAKEILLVGFDMQATTKRHFFGDHPPQLMNAANYQQFIAHFDRAATQLPPGVRIVNCTPGSALRCFPMLSLEEAKCSTVPA